MEYYYPTDRKYLYTVHACTYLCTELSPCLGLSTDNGTDVWLKDAQYAVCTSMSLYPSSG